MFIHIWKMDPSSKKSIKVQSFHCGPIQGHLNPHPFLHSCLVTLLLFTIPQLTLPVQETAHSHLSEMFIPSPLLYLIPYSCAGSLLHYPFFRGYSLITSSSYIPSLYLKVIYF